MKNKIIMVTYFFNEKDGVGAARSLSLSRFLKTNGVDPVVLNKNTWSRYSNTNSFFWGIKCVKYLVQNKNSFSKIYISCGPFLPLLPVVMISCFMKKIVLVDFRDPWSPNIAANYGQKLSLFSLKRMIKLSLSRLIEKYVYRKCKYFIVCTEGMKFEYAQLFGDDKKIKLITNGYDFEPDHYRKKRSNNNISKYVCLGKFAEYSDDKAYKCLEKIKNNHKHVSDFCIEFIGTDKEKNEPLVKKLKLHDNVLWHNSLPYTKALDIASNADFGIVLLRNENTYYGTKVFDYIGLGIPVFDIFDNDSIFKKLFSDYISSKKKIIPMSMIKKYHRFEIFKMNSYVFMDDDQ